MVCSAERRRDPVVSAGLSLAGFIAGVQRSSQLLTWAKSGH